jgi:hypothetical protein
MRILWRKGNEKLNENMNIIKILKQIRSYNSFIKQYLNDKSSNQILESDEENIIYIEDDNQNERNDDN